MLRDAPPLRVSGNACGFIRGVRGLLPRESIANITGTKCLRLAGRLGAGASLCPVAISGRKRKALPRGAYVYGPRSPVGGKGRKAYPIDTPKRARAALSRSAQKNTGGSYSTVAKAVRRKYGNSIASVGKKRGTVSKAGYRKRK
jgi:hypothetical protein